MDGRTIAMLVIGLLVLAGVIFGVVASATASARAELPDDGGPT